MENSELFQLELSLKEGNKFKFVIQIRRILDLSKIPLEVFLSLKWSWGRLYAMKLKYSGGKILKFLSPLTTAFPLCFAVTPLHQASVVVQNTHTD